MASGTDPGSRGLKPYATAAQCIDWDQPMLSIFATRADARAWAVAVNAGRPKADRVGIPQRPLKPKTQKRLAGGLDKWVLKAAEPFVVRTDNHQSNSGCVYGASEPLTTVTSAAGHAAVDAATTAPYVARVAHGDEAATGNHRRGHTSHGPADPLPTVTASKDYAIAGATLASFASTLNHGGPEHRAADLRAPLSTVTGANDARGLVAVALNKHFGGVVGQAVDVPLGTITGVDHHSVLACHLTKYHGSKGDETRGQPADEAFRTLDTENRFGVVAAHLTQFYGRSVGGDPAAPHPTVTGHVRHTGVVAAHLVKFRGESPGTSLAAPMDTVTAGSSTGRPAGAGHAMGLASVYLSHMYTSNTNGGQGDPRRPLKTITSGGQHAKVCVVYLSPYYGSGSGETGHKPADPMPTATAKARFAAVSLETCCHWVFSPAGLARARQVARWARQQLGAKVDAHLLWVADEAGRKFALLTVAVGGALHVVTDIAMRMLRPRELARAQGFPDDYVIDRTADGKPVTKADQVKLIGNSVCPQMAEALARANVVELGVMDAAPATATA